MIFGGKLPERKIIIKADFFFNLRPTQPETDWSLTLRNFKTSDKKWFLSDYGSFNPLHQR